MIIAARRAGVGLIKLDIVGRIIVARSQRICQINTMARPRRRSSVGSPQASICTMIILMKQQLLEQSVIHADETVVQALKEDNKPAASESRMWLYASGEYSNLHIRIFDYQPDRSGKRPESFLKGFNGCLITDGYAGYNRVQQVTPCGCWAHASRKWREAMPDGATVKTSKAAVGFRYCTKLFSLEQKYTYADVKVRKEHR